MSHAELTRFAAAAKDQPALIDRYADAVSAAEVAERLQRDGYDVTVADVQAILARGGQDLSDEQLEGVSGGSLLVGGVVIGTLLVGLGLGIAATVSTAIMGARGQHSVD